MDHAVDIDGEQDAAAEPTLAELATILGRLVEYVWKRQTTKRIALRRKRLDALRGLISRIGLLLILTTQLVARWIRRAVATALPETVRRCRHLHHPPQTWAAP